MIFFKPSWVNHEENKPIFSVDIHPKGGRFATGGQGGSGGRIVIWNISPVVNEGDESDPKVPKMLCQMDNHLACVNVVRWSNSGHLLASGGDDKLVMVWRLTNEGGSTIFGSGKTNVETWKCVSTLNSHNGDVLDLAWAPHDAWLASSSVDNTVIVWNAHKFPEKIAVLKNHTGMVKGVAWDPVGKYMASQSDDKSLRIWRTSDWTQQEVVTDPFQECSATTHVLRLSWSPDGQYLVSAHAMNGGGPTAQIIEREGWKQDKDFVGHRKAVTCVRFNLNILKKQTEDSPKPQQYCCCAIGSRDRSISVWLTSLKRPLVVIKDLFDNSVLDISWSSNGLYLLACSWDGTVACVTFSQDEIGTPLTMDEKNALYERMYHKSLQKNWNLNLSGTQIVENPELLSAIEEMNEKEERSAAPVPPPPTPLVESVGTPPTPCLDSPTPKLGQSVLVSSNKQVETRLPSGKRRITPMLLTSVPTSGDVGLNALQINTDSQLSNPASFSRSSPTKSQIIVETVQEPSVKPKSNVPSVSTDAKSFQKKEIDKVVVQPPGQKITQLVCCEVPGDLPIVKYVNMLDPVKFGPGVTISKDAGTLKIQVTNNCHKTPKGSIARIEVYKTVDDKQPIWDTYLGASVRCLAANRRVVVACCDDLTVNVYDVRTGARPLPPLLVEDPASSLTLSEAGRCLVLTRTGLVHVWDLAGGGRCVLARASVRGLLGAKANVTGCSLSSSNQPVVTLSDGRAYSYSMDLQTWVLLSNPLDPVVSANGALAKALPSTLPLAALQRAVPSYRSADSLPSGVTLSFLESQIAATSVLQSVVEYKHWLIATVNHLLDKGPECRLRMILDDLMGPNHRTSKKAKVDDKIMGLSKASLLKEILDIIKTKLPWQRLYKEYSEQLSDC